MANDCYFDMMVVSPNRESVERMYKIMKYEDPEYYIYRVRDVSESSDIEYDDISGLYYQTLCGDVAWSASRWVTDEPNPEDKAENGAGYTVLPELAKVLDISFEVFTEECGMCFSEYLHITPEGVVEAECCDYHSMYLDDDDWEYLSYIEKSIREVYDTLSEDDRKEIAQRIWDFRQAKKAGEDACLSFDIGGFPFDHSGVAEVVTGNCLCPEANGIYFSD